jgi:hypothetical protein
MWNGIKLLVKGKLFYTRFEAFINQSDEAVLLLCLLNQDTRNRVKTWCQFTWSSQKSFDERDILQYLPAKMMTGKLTDLPNGLGHETKLRYFNKTDSIDSHRSKVGWGGAPPPGGGYIKKEKRGRKI